MVSVSQMRRWIDLLKRTPLHPQWLIPGREAVVQWLEANARGTVLDIGCATRWVEDVLPSQCTYIGMDYPSTGKLMYGARPMVFASATALPFPDKTFDVILLSEVLEHVREPQAALREASRVLKVGGSVLVTIPFLYPIHDAPHDYQRYTAFGLEREVESAGMRVVKMENSLSAVRTAGVLTCLAVGGGAYSSFPQRRLSLVATPFLAVLILLINLLAWMLDCLLPDWPALTLGYRLEATRDD